MIASVQQETEEQCDHIQSRKRKWKDDEDDLEDEETEAEDMLGSSPQRFGKYPWRKKYRRVQIDHKF